MNPHISIVVSARNDDYGGNFLVRLQRFVNSVLLRCRAKSPPSELIIVEWNPPPDRKPLKNAIVWPSDLKPCVVRIVSVPNEIHTRLPNSERISLFEYIAKNVGIRRAKGDFVVVTNPDLLFSKELVHYLIDNPFSLDRFYRIDRYDFRSSINSNHDPEINFKAALRRVYQVHAREASLTIGAWKRWYCFLTGKWPSSATSKPNNKSDRVMPLNYDTRIYGAIHTNASGDFIAAPKECWYKIKGFPEFTDTYTHLDSYACYQFKSLGLDQALFIPPCMILHADHDRTEQRSRPVSEKWHTDLELIWKGSLGPAINDDNWGLRDDNLQEFILA